MRFNFTSLILMVQFWYCARGKSRACGKSRVGIMFLLKFIMCEILFYIHDLYKGMCFVRKTWILEDSTVLFEKFGSWNVMECRLGRHWGYVSFVVVKFFPLYKEGFHSLISLTSSLPLHLAHLTHVVHLLLFLSLSFPFPFHFILFF